jgi:hypothetical protein
MRIDALGHSPHRGRNMTPTTTIRLDAQTAKSLADYAAALGLTVEDYLKKHFVDTNGPQTVEDVDHWLDELAEGLDLPALPLDFSTKDIYVDHD